MEDEIIIDPALIPNHEITLFDEKSDVQAILVSLTYFENLYKHFPREIPDLKNFTSKLLYKALSLIQKYKEFQKNSSGYKVALFSVSYVNGVVTFDLEFESQLFIDIGVVETFIQITESREEPLCLMALATLRNMAESQDFARILANGNWQRLFNLLPKELSEAHLSNFELELFGVFFTVPEALRQEFDQFNTILQRGLVYLFNPITKTEGNIIHVCHLLVECFAWLDEQNPIEVDYVEIGEHLLSIMKAMEKEGMIKVLITIGVVFREIKGAKYYKIRKETTEGMLNVLETTKVSIEVLSDLVVHCFSLAKDCDEMSRLILENQKYIKSLLKCVSHGNANQQYLVPVMLSFFCSFPTHGVRCFVQNNFMKPLLFLLQVNASELQPDAACRKNTCFLLEGLEQLLKEAENFVDGNEFLHNPIALQIEERRGLEILKRIGKNEDCEKTAAIAKRVILKYFGEKWEEYLARRRGLKTKRALKKQIQ